MQKKPWFHSLNFFSEQLLFLKLGTNALRLIYLGLFLSLTLQNSWAQVTSEPDSLRQASPVDSIEVKGLEDSLRIGGIETTITYYAEDSIVSNLINSNIYLYGNARVDYGDISLTAAQIEIDQGNKLMVARGITDSTGRWQGKPQFTQDGQSYEADSMRYNFETKKGVVIGIVTQQGEGYIQSQRAKRLDDGTMFAARNQYTTCNLKHPHWYIGTNKIKMIPDKQVVSGPFNLVIADVPTPLGFAFGIFPFVDKRRSGIIFPTYGESEDRGFFLRNGGYYWYINEYMALEMLGEMYTNGSWGVDIRFPYRKRYRFSGNSSVRFSRRFQGEGDTRTEFQDFWIRWNHTPIPRGNSTFSASVNFGTSQFNQRNSFNPEDQLSNSFNSNINYSTSFNLGQTPVSLGVAIRHDQNSQTEVMNLTLPSVNLTVNRIYPFKKKGVTANNFLQKLNFNYRFDGIAKLTNQSLNYNQFPFEVSNRPIQVDPETGEPLRNEITGDLLPIPSDSLQVPFNLSNFGLISKNAQIGGVHSIPISTSLKLGPLSLNPSFTYTEAWYPKQLDYSYDPVLNAVKVDTLSGFFRVGSYSTSASITTRVYGFFTFAKKEKNKNRYLQAIRHTIIPTIGFGYRPNFSGTEKGFIQEVQVDAEGNTQNVSRYQGFNPAAPISNAESGVINFSIQNIFEAKVKPKKDTVDTKKIKLLDNLSFAGNYNLVRDSLNLSNISISARTRLLDLIDFNFTGSLDPYVYRILEKGEDGRPIRQTRINRFAWQEGLGLGQLSAFNISMGANFTPETFKNSVKRKAEAAKDPELGGKKRNLAEQAELDRIAQSPEEYVDFDIPWTLRLTYNLSYSKVGFLDSRITQKLNFSGDLSLTETWKIGFRSGYDFDLKRISYTNINIFKDLHCWEMSFNWNPFGQFQSYNFEIRVKSSILQDLKISRRRSFYDRSF